VRLLVLLFLALCLFFFAMAPGPFLILAVITMVIFNEYDRRKL